MSSDPSSIHVALITPSSELVERCCEDLGCHGDGDQYRVVFQEREVLISPVSRSEDMAELPPQALLVLPVRFVDVRSLKDISDLWQAQPGIHPGCVFICRNERESDFKMSCPTCGQKLWVSDVDEDKRGQCPQCRKGFKLPSQEDHLRSILSLPSSCAFSRITRGDTESARSCMKMILEKDGERQRLDDLQLDEALMNETMRVTLPPQDSGRLDAES